MAYDPRTGIQSFAQADPSADVNAAIDVPEAVAPSTATALAPRGPAPTSIDELYDRYYGDWRTSNMWGGAPPAPGATYDDYNMQWLGGARPAEVATRAAQAGSLEDWLFAVDQALGQTTYDDPYNMTGKGFIGGYDPYGTYGEGLIRAPLDAVATAAGAGDVDWSPYLDQYWMDEWLDQVANRRPPEQIFSHRQGYGDTLLGVLDGASQGLENPALAELGQANFGPGTDFYRDYNTLGNWMESRRDEVRDAKALGVTTFLLSGLLAPYLSEVVSPAVGGGAAGTIATGAAMGGLQGLAAGDPVGGALRGGLTAGVQGVVAPYVGEMAGGMLSRLGFSPETQYGGVGLDDVKRVSTATAMPAAVPEVDPTFGGALSRTGPGMFSQFSGLMPPAIPEAPADLAQMGLTQTAPDTWERLGAAGAIPSTSPSYDAAAPDLDVSVQEPSPLDQAGRYVKLGQALASLGGGRGAPQDAPQREEGQSDADYVQSLAEYANVNVDAQALAEMGLTPGTPEYYGYLMGQLDPLLAGYEDADDLIGQLRGKTQAELTALRRALYVRGQLEQLMGSGTYADPFTGIGEEVIAGGRTVNPGVAAYQRGLGRTIGEFADLGLPEREGAIQDFLGRDTDAFGMQARADERAEQEARALAVLEAIKRRQGGMLGSASGEDFAMLLDLMQQQQW